MKEWFLGRGQTLISLVVTVGALWGSVALSKRYPDDAGTWLVPILATLTAVATALGRALVEPKKDSETK